MATKLSNSGVTFGDATVQGTAALSSGVNLATGNGGLFSDKTSDNLRFKRLAVSGNYISIAENSGTITLTWSPPPPPCPPVSPTK